MSVDTLAAASILLSATGIILTTYLTAKSWLDLRRRPTDVRSWRFIASLALLVAFLTLLTSGVGALLREEYGVLLSHLAFLLRGGLLALTIAVVYGWTHIDKGNPS